MYNQELVYVYLAIFKLIILGIITTQYIIAGRGLIEGFLGRRRVFIPTCLCIAWLASAFVLKTISWMFCGGVAVTWILYFCGMSLGYGSNGTMLNAIWRRGVYGLAVGSCAVAIACHAHSMPEYLLGICVSVGSSVVLGVWNNITNNAVVEEALICIGSFSVALFLI